ncbi:MAG: hypothetical protein JRN39_07545 [Nitrososphaerota archaeon]|nr:hypothetical protein [Nitrososphaerota archaeon]
MGPVPPWGLTAQRSRLLTWAATSTIFSVALYPAQVTALFQKAFYIGTGDFNAVPPSYPLGGVALAALFLLLRGRELASPAGTGREARARAVGFMAAFGPLGMAHLSLPVPGAVVAGVSLLSAWFGLFILFFPSSCLTLLKYLALYAAAVVPAGPLQSLLGDGFARLAVLLSRPLLALLSVPASTGLQTISFVGQAGNPMTVDVTAACSFLPAAGIFLLMVGLMHMDLRAAVGPTVLFAAAGTGALLVLDSARVAILSWAGYVGNWPFFWDVHGWIGYALFVGFYVATLAFYFGRGSLRELVEGVP